MEYVPQYKKQPSGFATKVIHSGRESGPSGRPVVPPIVTSTVFSQDHIDDSTEFFYGRAGNPCRKLLEDTLADIEDAKSSFIFSSGQGSVTGVFSTLNTGDHVICSYHVFGGTGNIFKKLSAQFGLELDFIDSTNLDELKAAIKDNTKMVMIETPANPITKVTDIQATADILKSHKTKIVLVVDNTFLTPYFQRPLELGADIVLYSMTKYMNGHSDVIMGAVVTNCPDLAAKLQFSQKTLGIIPSPFDCYQVLRSFKTLVLRLEQHSKTSLLVAKFLESHPFVKRVMHPGLPSHPHHQLALKQSYGHTGIMAFYVKGNVENAKNFMHALKLITRAGSLGGPESVVSMPIIVSHASLPADIKQKLDITDNLIRLSVGLEDAECLIADLNQALEKSQFPFPINQKAPLD